MSAYLQISKVTKTYDTPKGLAIIVQDFDLEIQRGEFVALIGHSGCGKSTVLSMVAGLSEISGGGIILAAKELNGAGPDRGVVFQSPCLLPWLTALQNVMLGVNQVYYTASKQERLDLAKYYLSIVGLADDFEKYPAELSQGMRQRVGIARAFALQPKMLLLDEPFGMLDSLTRAELQEVLIDVWRRNQITTLMVTHDVDEAIFLADKIVMMTNGPKAEVGEILAIPFAHPRNRKELLGSEEYHALRERCITFLEERSHLRPSQPTLPTVEEPASATGMDIQESPTTPTPTETIKETALSRC